MRHCYLLAFFLARVLAALVVLVLALGGFAILLLYAFVVLLIGLPSQSVLTTGFFLVVAFFVTMIFFS
jgi:hypothetical protein